MYVINFFGDGVRYWICDTSSQKWEPLTKYREENDSDWNDLLFDLSFLKKFGFDHWSVLATKPEAYGFLLSDRNRIEIKKGARFLEKFRSVELYNDNTLFPRFQTEIRKREILNKNEVILMQFETGLTGKYKLEVESMRIDDLQFVIETVIPSEDELLFTELKFKGTKITTADQDTVVRGMKCISI